MRILVTGGAGYIGSVLGPALEQYGHIVTSVDNYMYGQRAPIVSEIRRGDARDVKLIRDLVVRNDILIPLAAIVGAPACDKNDLITLGTNVAAIEYICRFASKDQPIIYPNTNSGYGIGSEDICTEESPLNPISLYGRTKCAAEKHVMQRENSIAFRLATVYGPSPRHRTDLMVNDFVHRAVHSPEVFKLYQPQARRNFVHVKDVANAFIHAIDNFATMKGQVYNCGDPRANMTKAALCDRIALHVPGFTWMEVSGEDVDKRDYLVSNVKLEATGWKPTVTLDEGIKELAEYYQTHPERSGNA